MGELRALGRKCGGAGVLCLRRADPEAAAGAIGSRRFLDNGRSPCVAGAPGRFFLEGGLGEGVSRHHLNLPCLDVRF